MDSFIKASLNEHYQTVLARLEEYKDAIESMVALLYKKENITGEEVRHIIINFEKENGIESKVEADSKTIEDELKADAKMAENEK